MQRKVVIYTKVDRQYIPRNLKDPKKCFLDPYRGLNALQKGSKAQDAPSPGCCLKLLLETSRRPSKYLITAITYCLSNHKSGPWNAINTTLESFLKARPIQDKP